MAIAVASSFNLPTEFKFDDSDIIYIPHHGTVYKVTWKALKLSELIKTSFEDIFFVDIPFVLGETKTDEYIIDITIQEDGTISKKITLIGESYNNVQGPVFEIIIDLIKEYSEHGNYNETSLKLIHEISLMMLFDVYKAANYLNISTLFACCAAYIANLIRNKTQDEIKQIFSTGNDPSAGNDPSSGAAAAGGGSD
jgi:hypothetical protein